MLLEGHEHQGLGAYSTEMLVPTVPERCVALPQEDRRSILSPFKK